MRGLGEGCQPRPQHVKQVRSFQGSRDKNAKLTSVVGAFAHCEGDEFVELLLLGPKIVPLVVHKLALKCNTPLAIYLYNELEEDKNHLVDRDDLLN
ncbi:hypothetical protein QBC46DRAFT_381635 [Diplogelasinospora grovesii]|uniref:Uncharacterized protein n=1 Tax=Diplogelasinospora grovesii TaxID=303347 RepID=A0AAN6NBS7_9PEZI|nr:hypothetical protein QBC46DRAFT_381635 [Diplogelasinospora grovesii]